MRTNVFKNRKQYSVGLLNNNFWSTSVSKLNMTVKIYENIVKFKCSLVCDLVHAAFTIFSVYCYNLKINELLLFPLCTHTHTHTHTHTPTHTHTHTHTRTHIYTHTHTTHAHTHSHTHIHTHIWLKNVFYTFLTHLHKCFVWFKFWKEYRFVEL